MAAFGIAVAITDAVGIDLRPSAVRSVSDPQRVCDALTFIAGAEASDRIGTGPSKPTNYSLI